MKHSRTRFTTLSRVAATLLLCSALTPDVTLAGSGGGIAMSDNNTHIDRGVYYSGSAFLTATGGTAPYTFAVSSGLPGGVVVNGDGTVTGVTCGTNGTFGLTVGVTDSVGATASSTSLKIIVNAAPAGGCSLTFSASTLPSGNVGSAYSSSITATGGAAPYTYTVASGTLPTGLTLSSSGLLSGTPSAAGSYNFTILATDSGGSNGAQTYAMTIASGGGSAPIAGASSSVVSYNTGGATATAITLNVSGGTATSVAVASAAAHGTASASGTSIVYTPTANYIGSDSFTYTATNSNGTSAPATVSITVSAPTLSISPASLSAGSVGTGYAQTLSVSGGLAPYTFAVSAGSVPTGTSLSSAGILSGNPSAAGTYTFTVTATDSSSGTHASTSRSYSLTIGAAPLASSVSQNIAYNSGGATATPITLSLSGGAASSVAVANAASHGTASASGTSIAYVPTANYVGSDTFTYTATNAYGTSAPATVTLTVSAPTITLAPTSLSAATANTAYSQTISASGGLAPYTYLVTAGSLPAGVTLSGAGALTGTTAATGTFNFTITATDSGSGAAGTGSSAYSLVVNAAVPAAPTAGAVSQSIGYNNGSATATAIALNVGGGAATSVAVASAALHGTAVASGTSITYTPAAHYIGTDSFTYTATNAGGTSAPGTVSITVTAPTLSLSPSTLPAASDVAAYSQTLLASGGTAPYTFALTAGALPNGMSLNSSSGLLSGTASTPGTYHFTVTATDSSTGSAATGSYAFSLTVNTATPSPPVSGSVSQSIPYNNGSATPTAVTLNLSGGAASSVTVVGAATHGLATANAVAISYLPNAHYIGTDSFTYTASNAGGTSAPATVSITITAPTLSIAPSTLPAATAGVAYIANLSTSGGNAPYAYTITAGATPAGLTLAASGAISGTPTAVGSSTFTVRVTDSSSGTVAVSSQSYTLTVNAAAVSAPVAGAVSQTIAYNSGSATPTTLTLTLSGGPPTSVAVASPASHGTAVASGTSITYRPNANYSGPDSLTYTATNSAGTSAAATVSLSVTAPAVAPPSAVSTTQAIAYNTGSAAGTGITLNLGGGTATSVTITSAPQHGTASAAGTTVHYLPVARYVGTDSFAYTATNAGGTSAPATVTLTIAAPALTATAVTHPLTLTQFDPNAPFVPVIATGGVAPLTYTLTPNLPAGLTLNASTGEITGSATAAGADAIYTMSVTDATGQLIQAQFHLTVRAPSALITITPSALPVAREHANYDVKLSAAGGTAPYSWSVSDGVLPSGLTLTASGELAGRPIASARFSIKVLDANGIAGVRVFDLTLSARPDPTTDPNVRGQATAQFEMAKRFAMAQIENVTAHLRQMQGRWDPCANRGSIGLDPSMPDPQHPQIKPSAPDTLHASESTGASQQSGASSPNGEERCLNQAIFGSDAMALWVGGSLEHGATSVDGVGRNYLSTSGVTLGLDDKLSDRFLFGVAVGRGWARTRVGTSGTETRGSSTSGVLSVSYRESVVLTLDALLGYGGISTNNLRWVDLDSTTVRGGRGGSNLFASVSATSALRKGAFQIEPFVRADLVRSRMDAYQDSGATDLALSYGNSSNLNESVAAGVSLLRDFKLSADNTLTPLFSVQQQRGINVTQSQSLFYTDEGAGTAYSMSASALPQNLTTGEIAFRLRNRFGLEGSVGMNYSLGSDSYMMKIYHADLHALF